MLPTPAHAPARPPAPADDLPVAADRLSVRVHASLGAAEADWRAVEAMAVLTQRPTSNDVAAIVAHGVRAEKVIGSPGYPVSEADLSARIRRDFERSFYPAGIARQMAAIVGSGDRRAALRKITAPTMVIHGVDDPLVPIAGGRDTAATIPGARIVEIAGMGHNLPEPLIPQVLDAFEEVARTKEASLR